MSGDRAEAVVEIVSASLALGVVVVASSAGHTGIAFGALGALVIVAASYRLRAAYGAGERPEVPQAVERPREAPEKAEEEAPRLRLVERIAA